MPKILDITGTRIGARVAIERVFQIGSRDTLWKVRCDCGTENIVPVTRFRATKSCGCVSLAKRRKSPGESSRNYLYFRYKNAARTKNLVFELTLEDCEKLWQGNCHYCNVPPSREYTNKQRRLFGSYLYNGIDRLDNSGGYALANCVSCCKLCNYLKKASSYDDFVEHIRKIAKHLENS